MSTNYGPTLSTNEFKIKANIEDTTIAKGWKWVYGSPKFHYFIEGQSLCRRWLVLSDRDLELGNNNSPDNCIACKKVINKIEYYNEYINSPEYLRRLND
jgi:hypothetical protein